MSRTKKKKLSRSQKRAVKQARKDVEHISKNVLGQFWDLPGSDGDVYKKAVALQDQVMSSMAFIQTHGQPHGQPAGHVDDNALQSLITGATSSRDGSYKGFALALASICYQARSDATERALKLLCSTWTEVTERSTVQTRGRLEERLGFLYCGAVLVRGPSTLSGETAREVLKMLCEIAREQESWHLASTVVKSVAEIVQRLEKSGQLEQVLDVVDRWLCDRSRRNDGKLLHQLCLLRDIPVSTSLEREVPGKALSDCLEVEFIRTETESSLPFLWELAFRNSARRSSESLRCFWTNHVMPVFDDSLSRAKFVAMFWLVPLLIELAPSDDDIFAILNRTAVRKMDQRYARVSSKDAKSLGGKILLKLEQRSLKSDPETRLSLATFLCNLTLSTTMFSNVLKLTAFPRLFGKLDHATSLRLFVELMRPVVDHVNTPDSDLTLNSDKALQILETLMASFRCPILDEVMQYVLFCHGCSTLDSPELVSLLPRTRKVRVRNPHGHGGVSNEKHAKAISGPELRQLNRLVYAMFLNDLAEQKHALALRLAKIAGNFREEKIQKSPVELLRDKAIQLCLSLQVNRSGSSSASLLICAVIILEVGTEEIVGTAVAEFLEVVEKEHISSGELLRSLESRHAIVECIVRLLQVKHERIQSLLSTAFVAVRHFVTEGLVDSMFKCVLEGVEIGEDAADVEEHEDFVDGDEEEANADGNEDGGDCDQDEEEMPAAKREDTDESDGSEVGVDVDTHGETDSKDQLNPRRSTGRKNEETQSASEIEDADESDGSDEGGRLHKRRRRSHRVPAANLEETNNSDGSEFYLDAQSNGESEGDIGLETLAKCRLSHSGKSKIRARYGLRFLELLSVLRHRDCPMWREVVLPSRLIELAGKCGNPLIVHHALSLAKKFMKSKSVNSVRTRQTVILELERISRVLCSKWRSEVSKASEECFLKLCEQLASLPDKQYEGIERLHELVSKMLWSFGSSTTRIGLAGDTLVELIRRQPRLGLALVGDLSEIVRSGHSQDTRSVAIQALTVVMNDSNIRESRKSAQIETVFHNAVRQAEFTEPQPLNTLILLGIEGATHGWNEQALSMSASALKHATKDHREIEKLRKRLMS